MDFSIERKEFFIVFQPIYELITRKLRGLKVLLRWQHPVYGLISPDEFIPIAEEKGTINSIGEWVIQTACEHIYGIKRDNTNLAENKCTNV